MTKWHNDEVVILDLKHYIYATTKNIFYGDDVTVLLLQNYDDKRIQYVDLAKIH